MNEKPGMAEDFVLNGNCQTTQDQTLKEQLCQQPVKTLPQTGRDDIWLLLLIIATVLCTYGVMKHENRRKK